MATISASPRVAPLRWSSVPARGVERRAAGVLPAPVQQDAAEFRNAAEIVEWRLVGWIVAVFLGTLVLSGLLGRVAASTPTAVRAAVAGPAETAAQPAYTVAAGDTLWGIAQRSAPATDPRQTVGEIRELNALSSGHVLQPGEVLLMPVSAVR